MGYSSMSIALPTLETARRQAKLVGCSSNLHQIGLGLMTYNSTWGRYPEPCSVSVYIIYDPGFAPIDNRQNLVDIVSGSAKDIYFCPV